MVAVTSTTSTTSTTQPTNDGETRKTKKKHKKKRKVSKHVLKSQREREQTKSNELGLGRTGTHDGTNKHSEKKDTERDQAKVVVGVKRVTATKDPSDALAYLTSWKERKVHNNTECSWKFNKNTQSWLIRHMYDSEKVPKYAFSLLLEYLQGMPPATGTTDKNNINNSNIGNSAGTGCGNKKLLQIRQDAARRALRYKQYEKKKTTTAGTGEKPSSSSGAAVAEEEENNRHDDVDWNNNKNDDDHEQWSQLNDHDKRKEYKRARKILELLQE